MFYAIIWTSRLSLLVSLIRIARGSLRPVRGLVLTASMFLLAWAVLSFQVLWECETKEAWKLEAIPRCNISAAVPICQVLTDLGSDATLMIVPFRLFMVIREKRLRYRLVTIFGTSIITTIASIPHTIWAFQLKNIPDLIAAIVEYSVSLMVCNLPVLVSYMINHFQKQEQPPSSPDDLPNFHVSFLSESHTGAALSDPDVRLSKQPSPV
ncbi:hypothetical protein AN958_07816 [Leucoagaricus sp. SymC.cos]|nr:hypothetical protein AN958_07816 [Leucoagaricus sp. SymC.cos]